MNNIVNNIVKYLINDKYTVVINLPSSKLNDNRNIKKYCRTTTWTEQNSLQRRLYILTCIVVCSRC